MTLGLPSWAIKVLVRGWGCHASCKLQSPPLSEQNALWLGWLALHCPGTKKPMPNLPLLPSAAWPCLFFAHWAFLAHLALAWEHGNWGLGLCLGGPALALVSRFTGVGSD